MSHDIHNGIVRQSKFPCFGAICDLVALFDLFDLLSLTIILTSRGLIISRPLSVLPGGREADLARHSHSITGMVIKLDFLILRRNHHFAFFADLFFLVL